MAKWDRYSETFNGGTLVAPQFTSTFGTASAATGQLVLTVNSGASNYSGAVTFGSDLTNSYVFAECVDAGNQSLTTFEVFVLQLVFDASNGISWIISGGNIIARYKVTTINTNKATATYDAAVHRYFRIRTERSICFWDYSADGMSWTNLTSEPVATFAFGITNLTCEFTAGTFGVEASGTTATIDNVNIKRSGYTKPNIRPALFTPGRAR